MKCTSCKKNVADDAAVCPYCDAVLDASLYDAAPPEDDDAPPPPRKAAPKPGVRPGVKPGVKPGTKPGVKKVGTKPGAPAVKKKPSSNIAKTDEEYEQEAIAEKKEKAANDWRNQISEADWKENQGKAPEKFVANKAMDPELAMGATKQYLWELPLADKLALLGTSMLLISTFFPWKETVAEGDVLGILSSGIVVTILSSLAVAGIIIRTRKTMPTLNPLLPWVAQLGCVGISALWCLVYIKLSWDSTLAQSSVGNYQVWVSKPAFGLIFGVLASIASIVGTIFGLKDVGK
jgi:hypothetical protein